MWFKGVPTRPCQAPRSGRRPRPARSTSNLVQGLLERLDEVLRILDTARDADEAISDADLHAILLQHVRMRHDCAGRDDALRGAEVLAEAPGPLADVHQLRARCGSTHNVKPEHAAMQTVTVVFVRELLLRVRRQARVDHLRNLGMLLEELSDRHGGLALLPHAQRHRLRGLHHEKCRHRVHDVAVHVLHPLHLLSQLLCRGYDCTTCKHVVPLVILREALDRHVGTPVQGTQYHRGRKGHIYGVVGTVLLGKLRNRLKVAQREHRVRRSLAEDQLGVGLHRLANVLHITEVHESELHTKGREEFSARAVSAAVGAIRDDAMVTGLHRRADGGCRCGHAGSEGACTHPILQLGELGFQRRHGWVVSAGVAVPLLQVVPNRVLDKCRRQEERREDGPGLLLWRDASMNELCVQAERALHPLA
mmetsp:Transcript_5325/g.11184  ORF Transcript_5325/g.11184 Transcript_5325/m.11184 type:complete len:421 (-) Transcript_5325:165-1427(-)